MKTKYFSTLLITSAIAMGAAPALADTADAPKLNFACQANNGVPTTVAQYAGGEETMTIFTWKQEALQYKTDATPQELCDNVTAKLENYSAEGYDLSKVSFVGTKEHVTGLPAICASGGSGVPTCSKVLLTLNRSHDAEIDAEQVVSAILNPQLQGEVQKYSDRGIQSTAYQVNFWDLFGLNSKFFAK